MPSDRFDAADDRPRDDNDGVSAARGRSGMSPMRFAGAGIELASSTLILGGLGYWIDKTQGHKTLYWAAAGSLVGFAVGLYRLIFLAMKSLDSSPIAGHSAASGDAESNCVGTGKPTPNQSGPAPNQSGPAANQSGPAKPDEQEP